jgi:hypothetical protein
MFCSSCGISILERETRFCSKCGTGYLTLLCNIFVVPVYTRSMWTLQLKMEALAKTQSLLLNDFNVYIFMFHGYT